MREILFRGKNTDTGEWWYGDLFHTSKRFFIRRPVPPANTYYEHDDVIPETVGQYTGLTDKNGKKIFEGDILCKRAGKYDRSDTYDAVEGDQWNCGCCYGVIGFACCKQLSLDAHEEYEVVGNIHDNPELLEGGEG